ncbi:MAG: cell division protein ZapA [Acidobacteriota bacterium]
MRHGEEVTQVEIYGQSYPIKGSVDADYVGQLASYVDTKMKEIAGTSKTVDSLKVAVLAALNIADEMFQLREGAERLNALLYDRSLECARQLDQVLKR